MKITPHAPISRREFLGIGTMACASALLPSQIFGGERPASAELPLEIVQISRATKPIILIWLQGGASHFDTFDPREPGTPEEIKGPFGSIATTQTGVHVSDRLPFMARKMHEVALYRNIYHTQSLHDGASSLCLTGSHLLRSGGNLLSPSPQKDSFQVHLSRFLTRRENIGYIGMDANTERSPIGALQANHEEAFFVSCDFRNGNIYPVSIGESFDEERHRQRTGLLNVINRNSISGEAIDRWNHVYPMASRFLTGDIRQAFDLNRVPDRTRNRYGQNPFGNAALIASRLVHSGAKLVVINDGSWDTHWELERVLNRLVPRLDRGLSALIDELKDECIIAVASEFGRTPLYAIPYPDSTDELGTHGREHWPFSNFMILAGPGVSTGVIGRVRNDGVITGNDGVINGQEIGRRILNAAGYDLRVRSN